MIKYGELTTKGDNRGTFIKLLEQNIINALSDYKINIIYDFSRMYIECEELDETLINKVNIARQQFYISEAVSIAIVNTLRRYITNAEVAIKWPNDIYVGDMKICGILIENTLSGCNIAQSIVGVGLNINQREFLSDAPNPISLIHFTNSDTSLDDILNEVTDEIISTFDHYDTSTQFDTLHDAYISMLWRRDGFHPYSTPDGTQFIARITNVAPDGILTLTDTHNTSRYFAFKEVQAIL